MRKPTLPEGTYVEKLLVMYYLTYDLRFRPVDHSLGSGRRMTGAIGSREVVEVDFSLLSWLRHTK